MIEYVISDIFEYLRSIVNCTYISDMKFGSYHDSAIMVLREIDIQRINPQQYVDVCLYLGI